MRLEPVAEEQLGAHGCHRPHHPDLIYQLITGINAHQCAPGCPGTSVLFRRSADGSSIYCCGDTWYAHGP
jgi:hypothetical protein